MMKKPYQPMALFDLTGQNARVIGSGGLGSEAALGLAGAGAFVAAADIDPASIKAEALTDRIRKTGDNCQADHVDVCSMESVAHLIEAVASARRPIRTAVIASGITRRGLPEDFKESDCDRVISVNLKGCFLCCNQGESYETNC